MSQSKFLLVLFTGEIWVCPHVYHRMTSQVLHGLFPWCQCSKITGYKNILVLTATATLYTPSIPARRSHTYLYTQQNVWACKSHACSVWMVFSSVRLFFFRTCIISYFSQWNIVLKPLVVLEDVYWMTKQHVCACTRCLQPTITAPINDLVIIFQLIILS